MVLVKPRLPLFQVCAESCSITNVCDQWQVLTHCQYTETHSCIAVVNSQLTATFVYVKLLSNCRHDNHLHVRAGLHRGRPVAAAAGGSQ